MLQLDGKPLLRRVVDAVEVLVDEVIVVTSCKERAETYKEIVSAAVRFAIDQDDEKGPLVGALAGFEAAQGEYSLLLPFDSPFVSREVVSLLFDCAVGKAAVVPRWTNMEIEPLHAVYNTNEALEAAKATLAEGKLDMRAMVEKLHGVRYISTLVIEQLDPDLRTFFNVNTPLDLKRAMAMVKQKMKKNRPRP